MAAELGGEVPLVLAGHTHRARQDRIDPIPPEEGEADDEAATSTTTTQSDGGQSIEAAPEETLLLVEGSTGGGGLRALQGDEPVPLTASVLYFDPDTHRLLAYDAVTVSGLGGTGATITRHIIGQSPVADSDEAAGL
jgi:hypothetical protein